MLFCSTEKYFLFLLFSTLDIIHNYHMERIVHV